MQFETKILIIKTSFLNLKQVIKLSDQNQG